MAVITIGTTGATWALTAETGILVQAHTSKDTREKNQVRNGQGDFVLVSFYNPTQAITISGVIVGTTGVAAAAPGVELAVANTNNSNGLTTGGVYVDDVDVVKGNTEFMKISGNATRYGSITGAL
jgi:hypothetical protein